MAVDDVAQLRQSVSVDYGLHVSEARCVIRGLNSVHRLDAAEGIFFLKLYRPSGRTKQEIEFEHEVMEHLDAAGSTKFLVAVPLKGLTGSSLHETHFSKHQQFYAISREAAGRLPAFEYEDAHRVGLAVAGLHLAMRSLSVERVRQNTVGAWFRKSLTILLAVSELSANFKRTLLLVAERASEQLSCVPSQPAFTVHGDLCNLNCRVDGERVTFFDFDECGWGSQLYDMAGWIFSAAGSLDDSRRLTTAVQAYMSGYGTELLLADQDMSLLPHCTSAHLFRALAHLASNQMIPSAYWATVEEKSLQTLDRIAAIERTLF